MQPNATGNPYKQVYSLTKNKVCIYKYIHFDGTKLVVLNFDVKKDDILWNEGVGFYFTDYPSRDMQEVAETTTEIGDLKKDGGNNQMKRAGALQYIIDNDYNKHIYGTGEIPDWTNFKAAIEKAKQDAIAADVTFGWYDESKVYPDLKK